MSLPSRSISFEKQSPFQICELEELFKKSILAVEFYTLIRRERMASVKLGPQPVSDSPLIVGQNTEDFVVFDLSGLKDSSLIPR